MNFRTNNEIFFFSTAKKEFVVKFAKKQYGLISAMVIKVKVHLKNTTKNFVVKGTLIAVIVTPNMQKV